VSQEDVELIRGLHAAWLAGDVELAEAGVWTVRDGRAVRAEMFRTEAEALAAASRPAEPA
jgi:hypothetical protein